LIRHDGSVAHAWWSAFCLTYDIAAADYLAWRLTRDPARRLPAA
jgi:hypothetical protein